TASSSCRPATGAPKSREARPITSNPGNWPTGCRHCSAMAHAVSAITRMTSPRTSHCWTSSVLLCPTTGIHSDESPPDRPAYPVHRSWHSHRPDLDVDEQRTAELRLLLSLVHVGNMDGGRHLFLAGVGKALALGSGQAHSGVARKSFDHDSDSVPQRGQPWR